MPLSLNDLSDIRELTFQMSFDRLTEFISNYYGMSKFRVECLLIGFYDVFPPSSDLPMP